MRGADGVYLRFLSSHKNKMLSHDVSVLLNCECCVVKHKSVLAKHLIARYPLLPLDAMINSIRFFR